MMRVMLPMASMGLVSGCAAPVDAAVVMASSKELGDHFICSDAATEDGRCVSAMEETCEEQGLPVLETLMVEDEKRTGIYFGFVDCFEPGKDT